MNSLELIPGIGKKLMWDIINASKKNPFITLWKKLFLPIQN